MRLAIGLDAEGCPEERRVLESDVKHRELVKTG
jgi:hypothetical protein